MTFNRSPSPCFQEIYEEQVRFHQGILEAISFLNMVKTPPTLGQWVGRCSGRDVEKSGALGLVRSKEHDLFLFCCLPNKKRTDDKDICTAPEMIPTPK